MVPAHTATEAGASPTAAWRRELALLLGAGLTSALAAALCLRLWRARLSEPFIYAGDYFFHIMLAKGVCETGWHLTIPAVGAPAGLRLHAFPAYDNLQLLLVKLVCLLGGDAVQALNLVYLAGYPLVGMTAFYVLRRLALLEPTALVMAVLYALLPYHFARGLGHPFLAAYYLLPPVVLFAVRLMAPDASPGASASAGADAGAWRRHLRPFVVLAGLLGASGVYYPFFAVLLLGAAGAIAAVWYRAPRRLALAAAMAGLVTASTALNLLPTAVGVLRQRAELPQGSARQVTRRDPGDATTYALKLGHLLLPVNGHRLRPLARLKGRYIRQPLNNENMHATLGLLGSAGFLLLVAELFRRRSAGSPLEHPPPAPERADVRPVLGALAALNLAVFLFATMGGLGSITALVLPQFRSLNRTSVLIAFFSLAAAGLWLDRLLARSPLFARGGTLAGWPRRQWLAAGAIGVLAALDMTSDVFVPDYAGVRRDFHRDRRFVAEMEARLPPGSAVLQLPYFDFPERYRPVGRLYDYDHFRGYLHSRRLRWSYGALRGTAVDREVRELSRRVEQGEPGAARAAGFAALYLDTHGYADGGQAVVRRLEAVLGPPRRSEGGRLLFFPLAR